MHYTTSSHAGGEDVMPRGAHNDVVAAIAAISFDPTTADSRRMRGEFFAVLTSRGWPLNVPVGRGSGITISALRDRVGLCAQTGNIARVYADLLKLQAVFMDNCVSVAALVLPSHDVARSLGSNIADAARLHRELPLLALAYSVPTVLYSLELA